MAEFPESLVDAAESALRSATRVSDFSRAATIAVLHGLAEHTTQGGNQFVNTAWFAMWATKLEAE